MSPLVALGQRAWRVLREPARVRQRLDVERDLFAFARQCAFLRGGAASEQADKRLLVVSCSDWVAQVKTEILLASALRLRGWTPIVLTRADCRMAQRYFRAAGISRFIFLDQPGAADAAQQRAYTDQAARELASARRLDDLLALRHQGVFIGRHVLSTMVRHGLQGRIDVDDPAARFELGRRLAQSFGTIATFRRVLDQAAPQTLLFLEKGYSPYAELYDLAVERRLNIVHWQHAHRSDALALKRYTARNRHVHCFSVSDATWEQVRRMPWGEAQEQAVEEELTGRYQAGSWFNRKFHHHNKRIKPPEDVRRQLGLDPSKKTAVIFSHVLWDATFFFGVNLFDDYEAWLVETVKAACRNPSVNWVVKIHPDYVWKLKMIGGGEVRDHLALQANMGSLPPHVTLLHPDTDLSTFSLFGIMDYCLTVRGTIGIEASCFGIPVLTAGTGRYAGLGFTIDSASREEYLARLARLQDMPRLDAGRTELARRHAYALLRLRPCPFTSFEVVQESLERMGHPLDHNVVIRLRALKDLQDAKDLGQFAAWVDGGQDEDFLMPEAALAQAPRPEPGYALT